jgi:hypothetical protein
MSHLLAVNANNHCLFNNVIYSLPWNILTEDNFFKTVRRVDLD